MDSGNSGSMQSSSTGGDEEYDSRVESISAFFNTCNPTSHVGPMLTNPSTTQPPSSSSMYNDHSLFTNLFDHPSLTKSFNTNTPSFLDMAARNLRFDTNCSDLANLMGPSSSTQLNHQQPFIGTSHQESVQRGSSSNDQNNVGGRNPKKRSRASRRAPTTVLTTDTTNFRAMVQEFTGIPAPPFNSFQRSRQQLDLFGTSSQYSSPYLLRPFAHKVQQPPISLVASSIASTTVTTTIAHDSQLGYQMPSDNLGLTKEPQNIFNVNMQNHGLNFQPFPQGPQRYPTAHNTAILGSKQPQGASSSSLGIQSQLKMGTFEDQFGTSSHGQQLHAHHNLGGLQNIVSSEGWSNSHKASVDVTNNGAASSRDVHGDKGPENVAPRSEGMVESWICSSD